MVLGHAQLACRGRLPAQRRPSPIRPLKDNRCSACRLLDSPTSSSKYCLKTCPHQPEFAPTPNPFNILAGLNPSPPETRWTFDFVPTTTANTRRRGRRGGKRHKIKHTRHSRREEKTSDSIGELCQRIIALRLDDDEPTQEPYHLWEEHQVSLTVPSPTFSTESVRHHWAPQFRPNSLPTVSNLLTPKSDPAAVTECVQLSGRAKRAGSVLCPEKPTVTTQPNETSFFPISAFLAAPGGISPKKSRFKGPPSLPSKPTALASKSPTVHRPPTNAEKDAATAACRTIALRRIEHVECPAAYAQNTQAAGSEFILLPSQTTTPTPQPLTLEVASGSSLTSVGIATRASRASTMEPSGAASPEQLNPSAMKHSLSLASIVGPRLRVPVYTFIDVGYHRTFPAQRPRVGYSIGFPSPPSPAAEPAFSPHGLEIESSACQSRRVPSQSRFFPKPSSDDSVARPNSLITAPVGSPYPFINALQYRPPSSAILPSLNIASSCRSIEDFEDSSKLPDALKDLKVRCQLATFLNIGHGDPCWCDAPGKPDLFDPKDDKPRMLLSEHIALNRTVESRWPHPPSPDPDNSNLRDLVPTDALPPQPSTSDMQILTPISENASISKTIETPCPNSPEDVEVPELNYTGPSPAQPSSPFDMTNLTSSSGSTTLSKAVEAPSQPFPEGIGMPPLNRLSTSPKSTSSTSDTVILTPASSSTTSSYEDLREEYLLIARAETDEWTPISPNLQCCETLSSTNSSYEDFRAEFIRAASEDSSSWTPISPTPRYRRNKALSASSQVDKDEHSLSPMSFASSSASSPAASPAYQILEYMTGSTISSPVEFSPLPPPASSSPLPSPLTLSLDPPQQPQVDERCVACLEWNCIWNDATTSAVEWPTL